MRHEAAQQPASPDEAPASRATDADAHDPAETARLVADAADGDESAWETLVRRYGRRIYALAKSRLHDADAAEEIAQSVFATLAVKLRPAPDDCEDGDNDQPAYTETGKFEPWLFRIAMNRIRDEGRRRQSRRGTIRLDAGQDPSIDHGVGPGDRQAAETTRRNELAAMRDAIATLDDRDREIIELRHHGSLSFAQIADMLGEPIGTCLARHHRAVKKLRVRMEAAGATGDESLDEPSEAHQGRGDTR
jgi:RNA polymerase sigma-70 factor (ECF subfamily)